MALPKRRQVPGVTSPYGLSYPRWLLGEADEEHDSTRFPGWLGCRLDDGRYVIMRKLGFGSHGTVWLARDTSASLFVAVKILSAKTTGEMKHEAAVARRLMNVEPSSPSHIGRHHVERFLYAFQLESSAGQHACIVSEVYSSDVLTCLRNLRESGLAATALECVKDVLRQLLSALDYLHNTCGVIHGDVSPRNLLIAPEAMDRIVQETLTSDPSTTCHTGQGRLIDGRDEYHISYARTLRPMTQPILSGPYRRDHRIVLVDFGVADFIDKDNEEPAQFWSQSSPEAVLDAEWSTPIDIWSVGCTAVHLLTDHVFVDLSAWSSFIQSVEMRDAIKQTGYDRPHDYLARILETLSVDRYPVELLRRSCNTPELFERDGTVARVYNSHWRATVARSTPLTDRLELAPDLVESELAPCDAFLRRCLALDPNDRPSAAGLLLDPWLAAPSLT